MISIPLTDIAVLLLGLFYFSHGWRKGIIRTILGPMSLFLCAAIGLVYFYKTRNLAVSLAISILGPFFMTLFLSICLTIWHRKVNKEAPVFYVSRLLGAGVSLIWWAGVIVLSIVIISLIPSQIPRIKEVQANIKSSYTYALINTYAKDKIPFLQGMEKTIATSQDQEKIKQFQFTPEAQSIYNNKKVQKLFSDPEIKKQVESKNISELMQNEQLLDILQDKELMEEFIRLYGRIQKGEVPEGTSPSPEYYEAELSEEPPQGNIYFPMQN